LGSELRPGFSFLFYGNSLVLVAQACFSETIPATGSGGMDASSRHPRFSGAAMVRPGPSNCRHPRHLERACIPGDMIAPDFTLRSAEGPELNLYSELERSSVVLFFFPRAFTPVCTSEVCGFQDQFPAFQKLNASLLGVSSDSESAARRFRDTYLLQYPLLLDPGGRVRDLYRVPKLFGILPGRSTFVIGRDRRIVSVTHAQMSSQRHIEESLRFLQEHK
jgi:thioredoxin-dependent peroxiredoxin